MSAKQYFQKISLKKQYIIKFILLMLLPLLLIEIAFYTIHLRTIQDDAVNLWKYRLERAQDALDLRIKELFEIAVKVRNDNRLLISTIITDSYLRTELKNILHSHNTVNKLCDNIQIYYRDLNGVYSHDGFTQIQPLLYNKYDLDDMYAQEFNLILNSTVQSVMGVFPGFSEATIVFLYPLQYNNTQSYSTLYFLIPITEIQEILAMYLKDNHNAIYIAVLDECGNAVLENYDGLSNLSINHSLDAENLFIQKLGTEEYVVFYETSRWNDWQYCCAVPMRILVSGTERQQVLIIQISIMVALLSVGMAILLARDSYRPIRNLANSIGVESAENELNGILTSIENTRMHFTHVQQLLDKNAPIIIDGVIEKFLNGRISGDVCQRKLEEMGKAMMFQYYMVIAISISTSEERLSISELHQTILQIAMDIDAENSRDLNVFYLERSYEDVILLILNMKKEWDGTEHLEMLVHKMTIAGILSQIALGVGRTYSDFEKVIQSYTEAMIAMEHLRFLGKSAVETYDDAIQNDITGIEPELKEKCMQMIQYIRQGNEKMAVDILNSIGSNLISQHKSYIFGRYVMLEVVNSVVRLAYEILPGNFDKDIEMVLNAHDVWHIIEGLSRLIINICACIEKAHFDSSRKKGEDMIAYLTKNFADPAMSLDVLAEHFNLSSYYVSRFFSQYAGVTFREYVSNLRIEYAKQLLRETDLPVKEIVMEIGYQDASTFSKRFKYVVGVPPGEFRAQCEAEKNV